MPKNSRRGIVSGVTNAGYRLRNTGKGVFRGVRNTGKGLLGIVGTTGKGVFGAAGAIGKGALNTIGNVGNRIRRRTVKRRNGKRR